MNETSVKQTALPPANPGNPLDSQAIEIASAILISLGIATNGIAILIIAIRRKKWNITHGILASMFTASLLYDTVSALPSSLFRVQLSFTAPLFCSLLRGIGLTLIFVTTLHHCLICFNRYLSLAYPFKYRLRASYRYAVPLIVMIWAAGIITGSAPYYTFRIPSTNRCIVTNTNSLESERIYLNVATGVLYFLPLGIMIVSYGHLFYVINNKPKLLSLMRVNKVSQSFLELNKKLIQQTCAILGVYIILWMPYQISFILTTNGYFNIDLYYAFQVFQLFASSYLVINPLLFMYHISTLRKGNARISSKKLKSQRSNGHFTPTSIESKRTTTYESNV